MGRDITIVQKLEILPGNIIIVPGCEPNSAATTVTVAQAAICNGAFVALDDALAAIPGSSVVWVENSGLLSRGKFFQFPSIGLECPCETNPDYYKILRDIGQPMPEPEREFDYCEVVDQQFCGRSVYERPSDTYTSEGDSSHFNAQRGYRIG